MKCQTMQSRITTAAVLLLAIITAHAAPPPEPSSGKMWKVVFEDEFDGESLDRDKWDPYYNWGGDAKSYEHNYDGHVIEEYSIVEDGKLRLKCTKNSDDPYNHGKRYSVGVVSSTYTFTFGYLEGRIKMPHGYQDRYNGLWPAFWTAHGSGWPGTGEIDVIEYFGMNKEWSGHVHWSNGGHQQSGFDHEIPDATSAFHTYAIHWRRGRTDFYLDGEYIQTIDHGDFDDSQFIMINFGIGGFDWLGDPSGNDGNMPLYYETDFVRVWQEVDDDGSTSVATPGRRSSRSPALSVEKSGSRPRLAVELDKAQSVRVELFDALGNRIIDTRNHFHSGRNTLELPRSLAGMTGFCRVSGTGFTHTRRLFITR